MLRYKGRGSSNLEMTRSDTANSMVTVSSLPRQNLDDHLNVVFADFLRLDVANGDASPDTIRGYRTQVGQWVSWCQAGAIDPAAANAGDLKAYRQELVSAGFKPATIAHKLTIVRRFYAAARNASLPPANPAARLRPPRDKRALEDFGYLSQREL